MRVLPDSGAIAAAAALRKRKHQYLPLQYGFDRIIELCDEKIGETLAEAGDGGVLGMSCGYYYVAMKEVTKDLSQWADNYAKRATYLAGLESASPASCIFISPNFVKKNSCRIFEKTRQLFILSRYFYINNILFIGRGCL